MKIMMKKQDIEADDYYQYNEKSSLVEAFNLDEYAVLNIEDPDNAMGSNGEDQELQSINSLYVKQILLSDFRLTQSAHERDLSALTVILKFGLMDGRERSNQEIAQLLNVKVARAAELSRGGLLLVAQYISKEESDEKYGQNSYFGHKRFENYNDFVQAYINETNKNIQNGSNANKKIPNLEELQNIVDCYNCKTK